MLPTFTPSYDSTFSDVGTFGAPMFRPRRRSGTTKARDLSTIGRITKGPTYKWIVQVPETPKIQNKLTLRNLSTVLIKNWIYRVKDTGRGPPLKVPFN